MASFSAEVQVAAVAAAANCSIYNVMFDLDEALDTTTYFSTDNLGEELEATDEPKSNQTKSNHPDPLLVSTLPVVGISGGAAAAGCSVCMESFGQAGTSHEGRQIPCGHVYHAACIATWVSLYDSCPLCRCKVSPYLE